VNASACYSIMKIVRYTTLNVYNYPKTAIAFPFVVSFSEVSRF
jgi:hypothetical protein